MKELLPLFIVINLTNLTSTSRHQGNYSTKIDHKTRKQLVKHSNAVPSRMLMYSNYNQMMQKVIILSTCTFEF